MTHLLQSEIWQKFEKMEGEEVFELSGSGFLARGVVKNTPAGKYLYAKYGPELVARRDLRGALLALAALARKKGAIFVRIEPTLRFSEAEMKKMGCRRSKELNPEHTWVLPLAGSEEEILAGMEKSTVKFYRNAGKKGISVRISENPADVEVLMPFLAETAGKRGFLADSAERLKNQMKCGFAKLYIAEIPANFGENGAREESFGKNGGTCAKNARVGGGEEKIPIAASLIYDFDGVRYSVHSGSSGEYRKYRGGMVLSVAKILDAKREGMKKYDFWGITTSTDPKHPWYGFTQHKKSFGGEQVDYTGTYDLIVDKFKYFFYRFLRKINLVLRKI